MEFSDPVMSASFELAAKDVPRGSRLDLIARYKGADVYQAPTYIVTESRPLLCRAMSATAAAIDQIVIISDDPNTSSGFLDLGMSTIRLQRAAKKPTLYVAWTFDYGPDPTEGPGQVNYTQQVLDALEELRIAATFFVDHINIRTLRGFVLLNKMVNAGHEVGISGVVSNALHCSHVVVKQVTDRLSPALCAGMSARQCLDIHLDAMLSQLKLAGAVPRFARFPIGESYTCRALEDESRALPGTPCPAGEGLTQADPGLTFSELRAAFAARNIRPYLHGGTGVHLKGQNRKFGPDSWWLQVEKEKDIEPARRDLESLIAECNRKEKSACAIVLAHDYDVTDGVRSPSILAVETVRLKSLVGKLRTVARRENVALEFVKVGSIESSCGSEEPMDYRVPSECGL